MLAAGAQQQQEAGHDGSTTVARPEVSRVLGGSSAATRGLPQGGAEGAPGTVSIALTAPKAASCPGGLTHRIMACLRGENAP